MHKSWPLVGLLFFLGCVRLVPLEVVPPSDITVESSPDRVARGKYLATISSCIMCHTPMTNSAKSIPGMDLAGGQPFKLPEGGFVRSANITPDLETGIGNRTKENFIGLFKAFNDPVRLPEDKRHENTVMPWPGFAGMTEEDLGAINDYLQTVKPVTNRVEKYPQE